jgi:hypothetical protein
MTPPVIEAPQSMPKVLLLVFFVATILELVLELFLIIG